MAYHLISRRGILNEEKSVKSNDDITLAVPFFTNASTTHAASYSELAAYWAPEIYQDVNADTTTPSM